MKASAVQRSHAGNLGQNSRLRIAILCEPFDLAVELVNTSGELLDRFDHRLEGRAEQLRYRAAHSFVKGIGMAGRNRRTDRLDGGTNVMNEPDARADQDIASADQGQMRLSQLAAMFDRAQ